MVLTIYGFAGSTCTDRVAVTCKELNIPYELISVDLRKGEHKSAAYVERQPFGQVPVMDDDGFQLYESRAIIRYLVAKAGSPLVPSMSDIKAWAKFEEAVSIEQSNFDPYASKLAWEKFYKPIMGLTTDEKFVAELVETLNAKLAAYEKILSKQRYLAGNDFTLADLFHLPYGHMLDVQLKYDFFRASPNVERWWNDISSRETWQSVKDRA